ncbi:MAG: hypothetical protein DYG92_11625 [Leptolyngbya sp. PLA1]|nr:hypothetical protein [Leptolyngbya sp. PLA1]
MKRFAMAALAIWLWGGVAAGQEKPAAPTVVQAKDYLQIGDPAPALKVASWEKGSPVEKLEPGKVHVLLFFATHSKWSLEALEKLATVQREHAGAVCMAISLWERAVPVAGGDFAARVREYASAHGADWGFPVAYDGDFGEMNKNWMHAADRRWVPTVFVVDAKGVIAWIGHPMDERSSLAEVVSKVEAGTWDAKAAAEQARLDAERRTRLRQEAAKWSLARRAGDWEEMLKRWDSLAAESEDAASEHLAETFECVFIEEKQFEAGYQWLARAAEGPMGKSSQMLNSAAWFIADRENLEKRDLVLAMKLAMRASELTGQKDAAIEDTVARVHFEQGDVDKAIEVQRRAVALAKADEGRRGQFEATLKRYEEKKSGK